MRNFFRGSIFVSAFIIVLATVVSCEEDLTEINTGVLVNNKFSTDEIVLDLQIKPINLDAIDADRTGRAVKTLGESNVNYSLGVYKTENSKKIAAGFATELSLSSSVLKTGTDADTVFTFDKAVLRIPYRIRIDETSMDTIIDGLVGNTEEEIRIKVYQNPTFLHRLNPTNLEQPNTYLSNFDYKEENLLTNENGFAFSSKNIADDLSYVFDRIDRSNSLGNMIKDTLKLKVNDTIDVPFLTIPLDPLKIQNLFWDQFNASQFKSPDEFRNYFRGLIVKAEGESGALLPLDLAGSSLDILYSKTIENTDTHLKEMYSFPFSSNVQNNIYDVEGETLPNFPENFLVQGLAGASAEVTVLGVNLSTLSEGSSFLVYEDRDVDGNGYLGLKELASLKDLENNDFGLLANEASITFNVNESLSDVDALPSKLYIYTDNVNDEGESSPKHISDSFEESSSFDGELKATNGTRSYSFTITDYISDLLDGSSDDFSPLILKVFNPTDNPLEVGRLNSVASYNWNPNFVVLHDGDLENGDKKAQLKITFTNKK